MELYSFQKLKESFSKERRRQELQRKLSQKRGHLSAQLAQKQQQAFESLIPTINPQNYEENRSLLSIFAQSTDYSYEMLPIAFLSYEYLMVNPFDVYSWQILACLSYYEDFEIPQTEQLARILIEFLKVNNFLASEFFLNISNIPKCSLLCCRLVDEGVIDIIREIVEESEGVYWQKSLKSSSFLQKEDLQILIFNLLTALSYLFTLKPMLELYEMKRICEVLNLETRSNKFLKQVHEQAIFRLIRNVVAEFTLEKDVVTLLVQEFQETLENGYFTYEEGVLMFINLAVRCKVRLTKKIIGNIFVSLKSVKNKNKLLALQLIQKMLSYSQQKQKMEIQSFNGKGNFNFNSDIKQKSLPSFEEFSSMFSSFSQQSQQKNSKQEEINRQMVCEEIFNENYEKMLLTIFQMFESSGQKIQQGVVGVMMAIIKFMIRGIQGDYTKNLPFGEQQHYLPEKLQQFLNLTVNQEEFYLFEAECIKSSNNQITVGGLEILKQIIFYFKQQNNEFSVTGSMGLEYIVNQIHKFGAYVCLQTLLQRQEQKICEIVGEILNLMEEQQI